MSRPALLTKTNIIAGVVALLVAVSGGAYLLTRPDDTRQQPNNTTSQASKAEDKQASDVTVTNDLVSYKGEEGKTALELLKTHATVETKSYDFGELVTSINGQDGAGTKYWTFYINGAEAQVGAGAYTTKATDTIEWKLR